MSLRHWASKQGKGILAYFLAFRVLARYTWRKRMTKLYRMLRTTPKWWGNRPHIIYTITVFVLLASLDNAAIALYPALTKVMAADLDLSERSVGLVTALVILVTAVTAVGWGYYGDRTSRKPLLFWATVVWGIGLILVTRSRSLAELAGWSVLVGAGLGAVASVGFSVIADFIGPRRRGLAMSFWGLSQGTGGFFGVLIGGVLGADNWRSPFFGLGVIGLGVAVLYLTTVDAARGRSEPELAEVLAKGGEYDYKIEKSDLALLLRTRTNRWLILQGLTAQFAYGSLIWVPLLYQGKVQALGYDLVTATAVGSVFGAIFQIGGVTSILTGHLGDRFQRRSTRARAIISMIGILGAIPFFVAFFFVPLTGLDIPTEEGSIAIVVATLASVVTNPFAATAFALSVLALAFTSADSANWYALISDVNLPEHRGTAFGLGNLSNGISRTLGNGLTVVAAGMLTARFGSPWNYAIGLTVFQVFFLPTGLCYWMASKTCPADIARARSLLAARGGHSAPPD